MSRDSPVAASPLSRSATNRSIGVLVAGGQTLCLVLTLLAVPVFYSLWEDLGDRLRRRKSRAFAQPEPEAVEAH